MSADGPRASQMRIGVVLSAGGLRGVAHLGVMRQLLRAGVPIDVLVGVSAGAIIAGYYAGVGLSIEDMINDAPSFKGRHILLHGVTLRAPRVLKPLLRRWCGIIPRRLAQLESGGFDRLHHGVSRLGIVCHDMVTNQAVYFSSEQSHGARLAEVVKASAAVPGVIPSRPVERHGRLVHLVDGGLSDSLPVAFARKALGATHLIVSDCRRRARWVPEEPDTVYLRPDLNGAGTWRRPADTLLATVARGEDAVSADVVRHISGWLAQAATVPALYRAAGAAAS